jgi:hypothetical protein
LPQTAIASVVGPALAWAMLPRSAIKPEPARTPFPLRAVLQNRDVVILIVAYTTTIWGAVGLRQWVVVFLGFCAGDPARTDWSMLTTAALINLLGVPAGAEILSLLGYSIVPALLPQIMDGWSLSSTQGGWARRDHLGWLHARRLALGRRDR